MSCKQCGNQLLDAEKFCSTCGKNTEVKNDEKVSGTNETVVYAPAGIWRRLGNYILDRIFVIIIVVLVTVLYVYGDFSPTGLGIFSMIVPFLYFVFFESVWQKTLSKFITKTKVVMKDGSKPPFKNILGRSLARYIPFEPLSFLVGLHPIGWHDMLSNTLVVPSNYTEDDVKKIDIDKFKKIGGVNTVVIIIAIILTFIIIMGTLSTVVLVSLNTARQKGQNARIISNLQQMRASAEVYYVNNNNSYSYAQNCNSGIFLEQNINQFISDIPHKNVNCYAQTSSYAVSAKLVTSDKSYCVDSSGYSNNGVAVNDGATASCKPDENPNVDNFEL